MWISQQKRENARRETVAETGTVTLGGDTAGVYLSGERRGLPVYGPGGYQWRPMPGQQVLVLKAGADGESPAVAGVRQESAPGAGEVRVSSGDGSAAVRLTTGGGLALTGRITVNGEDLEDMIRRIAASLFPAGSEEEES